MKREMSRQRFLKERIEKRNLRRAGARRLQGIDLEADDKQLAARLLEQDDTLPGNRQSGFRFNFLLVILVLTPLYLWFELSFGVHLLDTISGKTTEEETTAIEHWGRLISGIAVSLLFVTEWFRQCEKRNHPWLIRILVTAAICLVCIPLTWLTQGKVIDFYVKRGSTEIALDLAGLTVAVAVGFYMLRLWLRRCIVEQKHGPVMTVFGLVMILGTGVTFLSTTHFWLPQFNEKMGIAPVLSKQLGEERQQAATLSVLRRGAQEGIYKPKLIDLSARMTDSPEGKAALALFPVIGSVIDMPHIDGERARIIAELMYRDWDEQSGAISYAAFVDIEASLRRMHAEEYQTASAEFTKNKSLSKANKAWASSMRDLFGTDQIRPNLSLDEFLQQPALSSYMAKQVACFDCQFKVGMSREQFGRELYKWTQNHNVERTINNFASASYFEDGRDGESAGRTYWVPIWALFFSMLGAFTHLFKMLFTAAEYFQRTTFHRVRAADSLLADEVVANAKFLIGVAIALISLFIFFSDNRVTSDPEYIKVRERLWDKHPVIGAVAAHWTINAQGLLYPFTKKLRPQWLEFRSDPLHWIPFASAMAKREDER
ncbi:MAG: hypothetical protein IPJ25_05585 [Rhodocyclaceae bacterium]|nr:hypothetical protein [Rhodocyclaceae bacterium]